MQFIARISDIGLGISFKNQFRSTICIVGARRRRYRAHSFSEIIKEILRFAILLIDARGMSFRASLLFLPHPFFSPTDAGRSVYARLYYRIDCAPRCWHNLTLDILLAATLRSQRGTGIRKTSSFTTGKPQRIVCCVLSGLISSYRWIQNGAILYECVALARNCSKWLIVTYERSDKIIRGGKSLLTLKIYFFILQKLNFSKNNRIS
jgi:hypothetical protein